MFANARAPGTAPAKRTLPRQDEGDMQPIRHRNGRAAADTTGWLLGTIIVVLSVLDLMIWATLWNVPNPVSKMLVPQAEKSRPADTAAVTSELPAEPAVFTGRALKALPPSRTP